MRVFHPDRRMYFKVAAPLIVVLALFCIVVFLSKPDRSSWLKDRYSESIEKMQLVQNMRGDLLASAEAEKSSVMADTDEASRDFAEKSVQAAHSVEKSRVQLAALTKGSREEAKRLDDFSACWGKLREMDKEILSLAVQNTNLKALRLSFVPAAAAVKQMEESLNRFMDSVASSPDAARATRLASKALTCALDIYALEAPHIAESADAGMDKIEARMKGLDEEVRDAFDALDGLVNGAGKSLIDEAKKSYLDFQALNSEIIGLSRRNSNIRSFDASLGRKRNMMAECLDRLDALQNIVRQDAGISATR